ncbi:hypothetical protein LOD99_5982 [Oopsacas minuta]|uniref:Uncharacterized protein n=1 Tax=Oopsacas minuta TaxID=111878 RepID=A0AAV7JPC1_9METZ|nr:hypothetical protein LOD99_5982 [Oopsacas minuta]
MEYSEEERIGFWDINGTNTFVWCHIILITKDYEKEIATDHFTHDSSIDDRFMRIIDQIQNINKYIQTTTNCIIEYRIWINNFPNALLQDQINDTLYQIGAKYKFAKIRFSIFFANTAHMMVKRLADWLAELKMNGISVVVGPFLVSRTIVPPSDTSKEMKLTRRKEDSVLVRKLWATLVCLSKNLISEKVIFMSEYSGYDYSSDYFEKSFSKEELDTFHDTVKASVTLLAGNETPYGVKRNLQIGFPPFCFIFKQEEPQDSFSKSISFETTLMKYTKQNSAFQKVNENIQQLCADFKMTKLEIRKVSLLLNLVSEQSRVVTENLWNVIEEMQNKYPYGKGVKSIIKESIMKIQTATKDVTMETQKNAEYEMHRLNQSSIELDYAIRELSGNISAYSKYRINYENLMKILVKLEANFEGNDLLLILEKVNNFSILSGCYEASKYLSKQQLDTNRMQTNDIETIEKMLSRVSKEVEWIVTQLELKQEQISKSEHGYVIKRQEFMQILRKNENLKHKLRSELETAKGETAKGELNQLASFSYSLKCEIGTNNITPFEYQQTTTKTSIICPQIHTDIEAYLDTIQYPKEDSSKIISNLAGNIQKIEMKLNKLAKLLCLDNFM